MKIIGLQKLSLSDYPGAYSCVVFLSGCNWRCPWCNALDFVLPEKISKRVEIKKPELLSFLKKQKPRLEAVVLSGGEPTIHRALPKLCSAIKRMKYKIKLDTNGSNPEMLEKLINNNLVDYIAMDVKATKEKYPKVIGFAGSKANYLVNNIEKSIKLLKNSALDYEFKTTFSPYLTRQDILKIAHWVRPAKRFHLQLLENQEPEDHKTLFTIKQALAPFFDDCEIS